MFLFASLVCGAGAQTYQVGPDGSTQAQGDKGQAPSQQLGWGSNIQNARLGRAAQLALQKGDKAEALEYAQRAAQAAPNDPQLWFLLGYAARLNGRAQQSVDAYSRGLKLSPGSLEGNSGLAQTYAMMGRNEDAQKLLKQVLAANPKRANDAMVLGDLLMRSGDYAGALEWLSRADRIHADARPELLMALCYQRLGKMDLANKYLEAARKKAPDNPEVQRTMAGYFRQTGKYPEAIKALSSIKNPKPDVVAELAYTYQLDGKPNDSASLYAKAANMVPKDLGLQLSAAQAQVAMGSFDQADGFLKRAAGLNPNHYRLHAIRGQIARIKDQNEEAVKEYNAALASLPAEPAEGALYGIQLHMDLMQLYKGARNEGDSQKQLAIAQGLIGKQSDQGPNRAPMLRLRAMIKLAGGDAEGALTDVKGALAVNARDPNGLQLNGDILMKLGRTEEAINVYKQILGMDANNKYALISLGYASRAGGHDQEAEKYFKQLAQLDPTLSIPYQGLGDLYAARHNYKDAQASYEKAITLAPKNALIVAGGANAAIEAHDYDTAGKWLDRAQGEMAHEPQVLREKERYLSFRGQYQQSADVAQEALRVLPHDRDVVVYLGYDLLHLEKYDDLLALAQKYVDVFPKEPDLPLLLGYVHKHSGQTEQAREDFTEALKRDPEVVTAYVNRGFMLNDLRKFKDAASDFESAIKRSPNDGEAHLGLAYTDLDMHRSEAALRESELAEKALGDSKNVHVIRATAYGREGMLGKAANEYRAALKFTPDDPALHLGLGNTMFSGRHYRDAINELTIAEKLAPDNAEVDALMARAYANLDDRQNTMRYVAMAEKSAEALPPAPNETESRLSDVYVSTGQALSSLGDHAAAMDRFRKALDVPNSNRVGVRLAIAQVMAQQGHEEESEREIALALMEAEGGDTAAPSGSQFVMAADVFRSLHDVQLSQAYLQKAKTAGAPDATVRIGLANNYLAMGDTTRAHAELDAVKAEAESGPDYQYLLAQANMYRQEHHNAQALTSFAQASDAGGDDQSTEQSLLSAGADEGLRITPKVSVLSEFAMQPIFEDTTVYVLDSKLDAPFTVPPTDTSLLPPPRSSIATQWTGAFHLHTGNLPTPTGFFQVRNSRGTVSVPATNSIQNRNTTDYTLNFGLNPTINLGSNIISFNSGIQGTIRRDSASPRALNQNLLREFTYMSTSSFFNVLSLSGFVIHEAGPFTETNNHSRGLAGGVDFRVGAPWGRTALVTGWGASDQKFNPEQYEAYVTSSYVGLERKFGQKLNVRAITEDLRAWRVFKGNKGIAQNLRPAGTVNFKPNLSWNIQGNVAYSSNRSIHVYDALQSGFAVTYARPVKRKFNDDSGEVVLQYPIRFSAGLQEETFFNFTGGQNQKLRPYVRISLF